jgi:succinate dehydrogenase / fumarate reductase cytochrome b subunit
MQRRLMAVPPAPQDRPLSPHLQVWRWHVTMATSILNRATGVALTGGLIGLVLWLAALKAGAPYYQSVKDVLGVWLGQVIVYGLVFSAAFHTLAGIRHLMWDAGRGFDKRTAELTAWVTIILSLLAPLGVYAMMGK